MIYRFVFVCCVETMTAESWSDRRVVTKHPRRVSAVVGVASRHAPPIANVPFVRFLFVFLVFDIGRRPLRLIDVAVDPHFDHVQRYGDPAGIRPDSDDD